MAGLRAQAEFGISAVVARSGIIQFAFGRCSAMLRWDGFGTLQPHARAGAARQRQPIAHRGLQEPRRSGDVRYPARPHRAWSARTAAARAMSWTCCVAPWARGLKRHTLPHCSMATVPVASFTCIAACGVNRRRREGMQRQGLALLLRPETSGSCRRRRQPGSWWVKQSCSRPVGGECSGRGCQAGQSRSRASVTTPSIHFAAPPA